MWLSNSGTGKLQSISQICLAADFVNKILLEHSHALLLMYFLAAFVLQQSCIRASDMWPTESKEILLSKPSPENTSTMSQRAVNLITFFPNKGGDISEFILLKFLSLT